MKTRNLYLALPVVILGFATLIAGDKDFWSVKSWEEWSEKEVEKLLKNSPWSKMVHISTPTTAGRGSVITGSGGRSDGASDVSRGGRGGMGAASEEPVFISWYARPIREALARQTMLSSPEAAARRSAERILNYDASAGLDFVVSGISPRMLQGVGPSALEKLKEDTYLLKKSKERIPAIAIQQPGGRNQPHIVRFARTGAEGEDLITLEDKEVELVTRLSGNTVRVKFKLTDMVIQGKPEF